MLAAQRQSLGRMALAFGKGCPLRFARSCPQHAVDEARKPLHAHALGKFHRRIADGRSRNLIKIKKLVEAEMQDFPHQWLDLADRALHVTAQDPIERTAGFHRAIDELRDKAAVLLRELCLTQCPGKRHIGIGAVFMYFI